MEVCGIRGQDAGGKMDYLSDCWGDFVVWEWVGGLSGNRQGQNERGKKKVNMRDDDECDRDTAPCILPRASLLAIRLREGVWLK